MPRRLPARSRPRPPLSRVAVLCFDPMPAFETAVAVEVFGIDRTAMGVPAAEVRLCTPRPGRIGLAAAGADAVVGHGLAALRWADLVVVPGHPHHLIGRPIDPAVVRALRAAHRRGAAVASFCSGAFVLAGAGLLAGRRATTHWMFADDFARLHPDVELDVETLYTGADGIYTAAGTASAIDLCLHLVREAHGSDAANAVARRMVVPPHRTGGQAQFVQAPVPDAVADDALARTLDWAAAHPAADLSVAALARRARMSPRTFARRFVAATGTTPLQWTLARRVAHARLLLETTDLDVERVASLSGFGSAPSLRQHFRRAVGTSPAAYRHSFRGAA